MDIKLIDLFLSDSPTKKRNLLEPNFKNIVDTIYHGTSERSGPWIVGGCGRQLALGESKFNDIDVWFGSREQFEAASKKILDTFNAYETFTSDNASTYQVGEYKVQLIRRNFYKSVNDVFNDFDFTCCQVAVDENLRPYGPGLSDATNMVLKLNKYDNRAFLARYAKYVGYGYIMDTKEFLDIIERLDMNYEFDSTDLGY